MLQVGVPAQLGLAGLLTAYQHDLVGKIAFLPFLQHAEGHQGAVADGQVTVGGPFIALHFRLLGFRMGLDISAARILLLGQVHDIADAELIVADPQRQPSAEVMEAAFHGGRREAIDRVAVLVNHIGRTGTGRCVHLVVAADGIGRMRRIAVDARAAHVVAARLVVAGLRQRGAEDGLGGVILGFGYRVPIRGK